MKTESPERGPTWMQSLPNEAQRCFMKHLLDLSQGLYRPEIQGALTKAPTEKVSIEKFHQTTCVSQRFATPLGVACDSLVGKQPAYEKEQDPAGESKSQGTARKIRA